MQRIVWRAQDLIDWALDHLSEDRRWQIIDWLMLHHGLKTCRVSAYFWATCIGDESIFELSECNYCAKQPCTYCGKARPSEAP